MSRSISSPRPLRVPRPGRPALLVAFALVASLAGIVTPQRSAPPAAAAVGDPGGFTVVVDFAAGFPSSVGVSSFVSCTRGGTSIGAGVFAGLGVGSETQTFTSVAGGALQVGDVCTVALTGVGAGPLPDGVGATPSSRSVTGGVRWSV